MPEAKITPADADMEAHCKRQVEWLEFRRQHLLSQRDLAEMLEVSARTVQNVEAAPEKAGAFVPLASTLRHFRAIADKFAADDRKQAA
jgi:DNA-binding XRE family transcriptional regulator